jgi:dipeptidyl aminopeptidase/acylaminoacyl peptidase
MHRLRLALVVLLLATLSVPAADRRPYTAEQLTLIRNTSEGRISPDCKTVAFVSDVTGAPELWAVPVRGGWPVQLTDLNESVADVRWSPDGSWLIFTSDYGGNERRDLFRVPAGGGAVERLTDTKLSESELRVSPDGKRLAFTADPDADFDFQLHVMDLATKKVVRLTKEPVKVQSPLWSPDGRTIAVTRSGDDQKGDLLLIDADTGAKVVVGPPVKGTILRPGTFAPDGKSLALIAPNAAGFDQLAVLKLDDRPEEGKPPRPDGTPRFIGPADWDVYESLWTRAGLWFLRNEGGAGSLCLLDSPDAKYQTVVPARGMIHTLSADAAGRRLAILREDMTRPADAWLMDVAPEKGSRADSLRQVKFSLLGGVKPEELSPGEMVTYESFDKTKIHTLFVKPKSARLGSPPPAVVYVHGGPNAQQTLSFDPFVQLLAEEGFGVIAPNYRGSTGYGRAFEDANNKDWGGGDLKDLLAAVKHFSGRGDIDPKRVGITGGSYGGYMTLLALAKEPDVFAAGAEYYGMPDLVMDYLLSKSRFGDWYETEMGNPKRNAALFRERSPLLYLDDIKAPLLVFQGANDNNVPKAESDLLAAILKELHKPYEYVVYDDEGHGFTRRKNVLDSSKRTVAFFVKHLGKK